MENIDLWDALKQAPSWALREIKAGRLKGKTDISPQWRMLALTERFGPCGIGWKYRIDKLWSEAGNDSQIFAFALVSLFIMDEGGWSAPIPGIGGSMLVAKESAGLHASDEGYKMAVTDALSVACKALGVAADIYMGLWDGSKYKETPKNKEPSGKPETGKKETPTPKQILYNMMKAKGLSESKIEKFGKFVGAKTETEYQTFIKTFDAQYEAWKSEPEDEPG